MSALLGAEKGIQMINVELNDVLDVVLNIPNAAYSLYFMAKACIYLSLVLCESVLYIFV